MPWDRTSRLAPTTARGYGYQHQKERALWRPTVEAGEATCWRCCQPISPHEPWDLGHSDDRTHYEGPEHRTCNRRAGALKAQGIIERQTQTQLEW